MHLAENSLFITLAKILWAFRIEPPEGEVVDVSDAAYEDGVNTLPKPCRLRFVPRNGERKAVLRREWDVARQEGFYLGDVRVETAAS